MSKKTKKEEGLDASSHYLPSKNYLIFLKSVALIKRGMGV